MFSPNNISCALSNLYAKFYALKQFIFCAYCCNKQLKCDAGTLPSPISFTSMNFLFTILKPYFKLPATSNKTFPCNFSLKFNFFPGFKIKYLYLALIPVLYPISVIRRRTTQLLNLRFSLLFLYIGNGFLVAPFIVFAYSGYDLFFLLQQTSTIRDFIIMTYAAKPV